MLQQTHRLLIDQLGNHIGEDGAHGVETLVGLTNVLQAHVIQENLLDDEDGDGLAKLGSGFHDTEAEGYDFGREKEVDDFGTVVLDQRSNDSQRSQTEILKRS